MRVAVGLCGAFEEAGDGGATLGVGDFVEAVEQDQGGGFAEAGAEEIGVEAPVEFGGLVGEEAGEPVGGVGCGGVGRGGVEALVDEVFEFGDAEADGELGGVGAGLAPGEELEVGGFAAAGVADDDEFAVAQGEVERVVD